VKNIVGSGEEVVVIGNMEALHSEKAVISAAGTQGIIQILASIYKDPVKAIIREYTTNAVDAHVEVSKGNVPIQVKLPTEKDPVFMVRDFGRGLSTAGMMNVFKDIGVSTKTNSNELTGGMGIGSKSCFSLVNMIVISSITLQNGIKKKAIYSYYKNDDQDIMLDLLTEELTEENTGLEIKIPVDPTLSYEFRTKATELFRFFKTTPKIVNLDLRPALELGSIETATEDGVRLRTGKRGRGLADITFIMGNIPYNVNRGEILKVITRHKEVNDRWHNLNWLSDPRGCPVYIDIPIGSVRIAPSREDLFYSLSNIVSIIGYLEKANKLVDDFFTKRLESIENPIAKVFAKVKVSDFDFPVVDEFEKHINRRQFLESYTITLNSASHVSRDANKNIDIARALRDSNDYQLFFYYDFVVEKPIDKRIINRLIVKNKTNSRSYCHLVKLAEDSEMTTLLEGANNPQIVNLSAKMLDEEAMKELQKELGDEEDPDGALDINALNNQLAAARKKRTMPTFLYGVKPGETSAEWIESSISPAQKGFYVSIYRFNLDYDRQVPIRIYDVGRAIEEMDKLCSRKLPYMKLYGIKRAEISRVSKKYPGLKPMSDFYNDWVDVLLNQFYKDAVFPSEVLRFSATTDTNLLALRDKIEASHEEIVEMKPFARYDKGSFGRMDCSLVDVYTSWAYDVFNISPTRIKTIEQVFGAPKLRQDQVDKFIEILNQVDYLQNEVKNSLLHLQPFADLKKYRVPAEEIVKIINNFVPDKWN
jgi:hypothetical protein